MKKYSKKSKLELYGPQVFLMGIIILVVLILFLIGQGLLFSQRLKRNVSQVGQETRPLFDSSYDSSMVVVGDREYLLYIADTPEKRSQGLSDKKSMDRGEGVAFLFDTPDTHSFWMKGMNFPLDFVFVEDGSVVDLVENVQPESYPNTTIIPAVPASVVIELRAGEIDASGVTLGDPIEL